MWRGSRIAVVVPAFREERLIGRTLAGIPAFVDRILVVDDASPDATVRAAHGVGDPRLQSIVHADNRGVGAAIVTGYQAALRDGADAIAVMAGDNQMHPDDLAAVVDPVVLDQADYAKGNRFRHPHSSRMPAARRVGGGLLSALTRAATGLDIDDSQCGYTAIAAAAAAALPLNELWPRFGYPNDLLGMLAARGLRVVDVPVRPVYADEQSGIRPWHLATIAGIVARRWYRERTGVAQPCMIRASNQSRP